MNGLLAMVVAFVTAALQVIFGHPKTVPVIPTPVPPIQVNTANINMNDLRYPNSTIISQGGGTLQLSSADSETTITDWYKEKIRELGMNNKSFVTTNTNGNVLNKLVGGNGNTEIRVTITKTAGDTATKIEVIY